MTQNNVNISHVKSGNILSTRRHIEALATLTPAAQLVHVPCLIILTRSVHRGPRRIGGEPAFSATRRWCENKHTTGGLRHTAHVGVCVRASARGCPAAAIRYLQIAGRCSSRSPFFTVPSRAAVAYDDTRFDFFFLINSRSSTILVLAIFPSP